MTTPARIDEQESAPISATIARNRLRRITSLPFPFQLRLRREAQDYVKLGGQLANLRILDRCKINRHRLALPGIFDAAIDSILIVAGMTFDITLRGEFLHSL